MQFEAFVARAAFALIGLFLVHFAAELYAWNEEQSVKASQFLDQYLSKVVSLQSINVVSKVNDGRLVHLSGQLRTTKALHDAGSGITVHAVKMRRRAEMLQWVEYAYKSERYVEGRKIAELTYNYNMEWRTELIRSDNFVHGNVYKNPKFDHLGTTSWQADEVTIGKFKLSNGLINQISYFHSLWNQSSYIRMDEHRYLFNGMIYFSQNPVNPQVGDTRVSFEYAGVSGGSDLGPPIQVSIIAGQQGSELVPYQIQDGHELELLYYGRLSAKEMFEKAMASTRSAISARETMSFFLLVLACTIISKSVTWFGFVILVTVFLPKVSIPTEMWMYAVGSSLGWQSLFGC